MLGSCSDHWSRGIEVSWLLPSRVLFLVSACLHLRGCTARSTDASYDLCSSLLWQMQCLVNLDSHVSWQVQYLVILACCSSWQ